MKRDHILGFHEAFLPLGPALKDEDSAMDAAGDKGWHVYAFETLKFEVDPITPSVQAPTLSGQPQDDWKTQTPSEPGWYMVGSGFALKKSHIRCLWDGAQWTRIVGMVDRGYTDEVGPKRQHLILWHRKATAEEVGEP